MKKIVDKKKLIVASNTIRELRPLELQQAPIGGGRTGTGVCGGSCLCPAEPDGFAGR
jgi:hypothetical protein